VFDKFEFNPLQWHHVVVSHGGSNQPSDTSMSLFVDGALVQELAIEYIYLQADSLARMHVFVGANPFLPSSQGEDLDPMQGPASCTCPSTCVWWVGPCMLFESRLQVNTFIV
jgi:hypothetical protein